MPDNKSNPKNLTYAKVYSYALELFDYDKDKTNSWWLTKQEELGGKAPFELVKEGKGRRLVRIIQRCK
ncbi:MAG TPA: hypothetical protein VK590_13040 [Saprospiraceae bacterium]|nr:hypothetical protein [Saprospiraceae bacterium]